jgi:two-component system phosphate regulon response regulator PhoB
MSSNILVVEDERDLRELLVYNLERAGFRVVAVGNGQAAMREIDRDLPDLILLDLMLPDMPGADVCRHVRQNTRSRRVPVVMVTAKGEEIDRVVGFEIGADDYVVKPFSPRELVLRVQAVLRRSVSEAPPSDGSAVIQFGPMSIDRQRYEVRVEGEPVTLTALEFKLLLDLVDRKNEVQKREELLERVWDYAAGVETRTVDTHVKRLREKLGSARDMIETVRGIGYRARLGDS